MNNLKRHKRYTGPSSYKQIGLSRKVNVYGRRPAPATLEESSRSPSMLVAQPLRLSKGKFMKLSEEDKAKDEARMKDKLSQNQQDELQALQTQINMAQNEADAMEDMYNTMENDWVDMDDDTERVDESTHEAAVVEELIGTPARSSEWASRIDSVHSAWVEQVTDLCDAYLEYRCGAVDDKIGQLEAGADTLSIQLQYISLTRQETSALSYKSKTYPNVPLLRRGYLSPSPSRPKVAFSLEALDVMDAIQRRSPSVSVQALARSLCDLRNVPYEKYHRVQLSAALDIYYMIQREAERRLDKILGYNTPEEKRAKCCYACTNRLPGERKIRPAMLVTGDGNDSLKRCARAATADKRVYQSEYYITRQEVDRFENEVARSRRSKKTTETEKLECDRRWKNASADSRSDKKAKTYFEETGVFVCTCRHSSILTICDMVKSGERAKYVLASINTLLDTFGPGITMGYDIGCTTKGTVSRSALLGAKAAKMEFEMVVGSFHGAAHNRSCQLGNHPRYRPGVGLTGFENAEHLFSVSNRIASATRLASSYHRHQRIHRFITVWNDDMHENLGSLLRTMYTNALKVLDSATDFMSESINTADDCIRYIGDERRYIASFKADLPEETFAVHYVELLERLQNKKQEHKGLLVDPDSNLHQSALLSTYRESRRRAVLDQIDVLEAELQKIEEDREIVRWKFNSPEWKEAQKLKENKHLNSCLDNLEQLVVLRIIEMSRAGLANTGYKLRMHIHRALAARSTAIRSALNRYNKAALAATPPADEIDWDDISGAKILDKIDILRDSRRGILDQEWTHPANRQCVEQYHRLLRAQEEIERLNIEIQRVATGIVDEEEKLTELLNSFTTNNKKAERWMLQKYTDRRLAINSNIMRELEMIRRIPGYTGSHALGIRVGATQATTQSSSDKDNAPSAPVATHAATPAQEPEACDLHASIDEDDDLDVGDDIVDQFDKWQAILERTENEH